MQLRYRLCVNRSMTFSSECNAEHFGGTEERKQVCSKFKKYLYNSVDVRHTHTCHGGAEMIQLLIQKLNAPTILKSRVRPAADPEILEGGERKTSPSSYITNAHKDMHIFYTGKRCLIEKILRSIRRGRPPPPPLNRPLHTTRHKCCNLLNLALIQIANNIDCNETFKP